MKYILSHPRLTKSANPLAAKLTELLGEKILVFKEPNPSHNCIIRYGNSLPLPNIVRYNHPEYIRLAGNKLQLSNLLSEKDFPHIGLLHGDFPNDALDYPIVVRTELNRGGGIGIVICENEKEFLPYRNSAWSSWYNFQFELGVHILSGEIVRVFKKIRSDGLEEEKYPIRNTQRGYKFSLRENWQDSYKGLDKFVKILFEIIPIQFARLDVGYDKNTGGYRLIEINSAPDLSQNENTLNIYAKFLANKIGG